MPGAANCRTEPREVALSVAAAGALTAAAKAAWPCEMVRLLAGHAAGDRVSVTRCIDLPEARAGAAHFAVGAAPFARAEAAVRAAGMQWLGFAHSHPGGIAWPSPVDRRELWRGCVQIVVGGPPDALSIGAFWLRDDALVQLPLRLPQPGQEAAR